MWVTVFDITEEVSIIWLMPVQHSFLQGEKPRKYIVVRCHQGEQRV